MTARLAVANLKLGNVRHGPMGTVGRTERPRTRYGSTLNSARLTRSMGSVGAAGDNLAYHRRRKRALGKLTTSSTRPCYSQRQPPRELSPRRVKRTEVDQLGAKGSHE